MNERIPSLEIADHIDRLIYGKTSWLATFAEGQKKRPDHEIEEKRRDLEVLGQVALEYRASAEKARLMREEANG